MIRDLQLTVGDICTDEEGLHVKVEKIDTHNRVHFSVIEEDENTWTVRGEMSHAAFLHRFMRMDSSTRAA